MRSLRPISQLELATLSAILAGGAALRFFRLTFQSLWFDELFSVVFSSSSLSVAEIVEKYAGDVHPLGYPILLHVWLRLFGDNDLAARSLSAVLGVIGIAVVYGAARRLGGAGLGLAAAAIVSVNAFHIAYSQEARSYALVFVVAVVSYLALLELLEDPGWRRAALFGASVAVAFHIHYYALVMFFGQVVAAVVLLAVHRRWRDLGFLAVSGAVVGVGMLPWIGPFLRVAGFETYWPAVPKPWFIFDYFHAYFGDNVVLSLSFAGLLLALPVLLRSRPAEEDHVQARRMRNAAIVLGLSVAASLAVAYARTVLTVPMLMPRFTFVLLPTVIFLLAIAVERIRPAWIRALVVAAVLTVSLGDLLLGGTYTEPHKEQWREAAAWVVDHPRYEPGADAILALYAPGFQYYLDQWSDGLRVEEATVDNLARVVENRPAPPVVWLLTARSTEPAEEFIRLLGDSYRQTESVRLIGTRASRWERWGGADDS